MNKPTLTRGAEGLDRWGWTNAQVQELVAAGALDEDSPMELIKGEIVPMNAEFNAHAKMRYDLQEHFIVALRGAPHPKRLMVGTEVSLFLFDDTEFKPDIAIFPKAMRTELVRGADVLLAIEVASSSQQRDLVIKPPIYAQSGLKELWVVDLDGKVTHVHHQPRAEGYQSIMRHAFSDAIAAREFPSIPVRIADFL
jgi:Uma2 family endonuclease